MNEAEGLNLRGNSLRQAAERSERSGTAALAKRAIASFELFERDLRVDIANAQVLRYKTAFDAITLGVCFFDGEGRLILSNRRYAEIYRLSPEQGSPRRDAARNRRTTRRRRDVSSSRRRRLSLILRVVQFHPGGNDLDCRSARRADHPNPPPADARRRLDRDA
jgi:PAS domain-containing protein